MFLCHSFILLEYLTVKRLGNKMNGHQNSKPPSAHNKIFPKHYSSSQKALKRQWDHGERPGLILETQLPFQNIGYSPGARKDRAVCSLFPSIVLLSRYSHSLTCRELFSLISQFLGALSRVQKLIYLHLSVKKAYLPLNWKYFNYIYHFSQLNFFHLISSFRRTLYFSLCFMLVRMILSLTILQCNTRGKNEPWDNRKKRLS